MADTNQTQGAGAGSPQQQLQVKVPDELQKGVYSNAVSVNVNSNEVVVDFGYLLPNTANPVIEVVSRINMNHKTAESFLNVLGGAMEDFKKKQAEADASATANPAPSGPAAPMAPTPPPPPLPENA